MDATHKQAFIRQKARDNADDPEGAKILWPRHGIAELANEGWARADVEIALAGCEVIEDYPHLHRPLPDCLVLGLLDDGNPIHAVVAVDEARDRLFIVTVYQPSAQEWKDDWRTRKNK